LSKPTQHSNTRREFLRNALFGPVGLVGAAAFAGTRDPMAQLRANRKIANAHEHVQDEGNIGEVLAMMDAWGMGKTALFGSSRFTITLYERSGFSGYDENNALILDAAKKKPDRFDAWPTMHPLDDDKLDKLKSMVDRGARGLKLYLGHGYQTRSGSYMFHRVAMDDPAMLPVYAYCEEQHLPICLHVNPDKRGFADEFVTMLKAFPDLKVNAPHFMLSTIRYSRLIELLKTFPNLYTDVSFGHDDFLKSGIKRFSWNASTYRKIVEAFPDRFVFGTDFVFTQYRPRTPEWIAERIGTYYALFSENRYESALLPGETLNGLALPASTLEKLFWSNYDRLRDDKPSGTKIAREVDWSNMRVWRDDRKPGEALPPGRRRWWD